MVTCNHIHKDYVDDALPSCTVVAQPIDVLHKQLDNTAVDDDA